MSYRAETMLRLLALVGLLIFAISNSLDWGWGLLLGFMLWPWPLMFTHWAVSGEVGARRFSLFLARRHSAFGADSTGSQ